METGADDGGDPTKRRAFAITAALGGLGVAGPLRTLLTSPTLPASVGLEHLRLVSSIVDRLEQADASLGGDEFCDFAIALHDRVAQWQQHCLYGRDVAAGLAGVLGDLESWIGWLALDAERRPESRRYLRDAIVRARLHDDPHLEVRAMVYLSLLLRQDDPRGSLQCAEAAQRHSAAWATPRLTALLHLRSAHAHAVLGDVRGFQRDLAHAWSLVDGGPDEDDPAYIRFVTPLEVHGIEGLSYLALGRPGRATRAFRVITESPDPAYRRNHGYYSVQLAEATRRHGDVGGASAIAAAAIPTVTKLHSRRTGRQFAALRAELGAHAARVAEARQFAAAYDEAVRR